MDRIKELFDYQRFKKNAKLEAHIEDVYARYLSGGAELADDELELVAAAGEPQPPIDEKPDGANGSDG